MSAEIINQDGWRGDVLEIGVILLCLMIMGALFCGAMFISTNPSSVASVEEVDGEEGIYDVTVAVPDVSSVSVVIEGDVERRVIGAGGGESFRVSIDEGEEFRVVEYYNPGTPVLNDFFSNKYVLFDSSQSE